MVAALWRKSRVSALLVLLFSLIMLPVQAQDAPQQAVASLNEALLYVMKNAEALGVQGRFERLLPVIERSYDFSRMTQLLVGPQWAQLPSDQQQKLIDAFARFSAANYAAQLDGYGGEQFDIAGQRPSPGGGVIVDTRLVSPSGQAVRLSYLMNQTEQGWRIVDVLQEGTISELARRRSEFTSIIRRDGAEGLLAVLEYRSAELTSR